MFEASMHAIIPTISKVQNTGQDGSGQSTKQSTHKYDVDLDSGQQRYLIFLVSRLVLIYIVLARVSFSTVAD